MPPVEPGGALSQHVPTWKDPAFLPENPQSPQWGVLDKGALELVPLPEIISRIEAGPGVEQWHGGGERPEIIFVTAPYSTRPLAAVECPELQAAILKRDAERLGKERRKSGLLFYPLLLLTIVLDLGFGTFVVLPAIFAMTSGASHIEAWIKLNKLKADPEEYLRNISAQLRYAVWLTLSGVKHWTRTYWMVGIWAAIGGVQIFLSPSGKPGAPGYLSAALVKNMVAAEPWRLVTATMLHGSIIHFLMNASAMLSLGLLLERGAHRHLLAFVWLSGAIAGSLLSWAATPATSVGASGGILAVFCFLLVMGKRRQHHLPPDFASSLVRSLLMIGMLGLLAWGVIDNAAHLGGAIAGAAIGILVFRGADDPLPLPDSDLLTMIGRVADTLFVAIAIFTMYKLVS